MRIRLTAVMFFFLTDVDAVITDEMVGEQYYSKLSNY